MFCFGVAQNDIDYLRASLLISVRLDMYTGTHTHTHTLHIEYARHNYCDFVIAVAFFILCEWYGNKTIRHSVENKKFPLEIYKNRNKEK